MVTLTSVYVDQIEINKLEEVVTISKVFKDQFVQTFTSLLNNIDPFKKVVRYMSHGTL